MATTYFGNDKPTVHIEEEYTGWEDTFLFLPRKTYYGGWAWGPAYKRRHIKKAYLKLGRHVTRGLVGGMISITQKNIQKKYGCNIAQYATGEEIFLATLKGEK